MFLKRYFIYFLLILLVIIRYFSERPIYKNGDKVRITATVMTDPINYEKSQYLKLAGLKIYVPQFPEISYGDKVVVEGTVNNDVLEKPVVVNITQTTQITSRVRNKIINFYQQTLPDPYSGLIAGITLGSKGTLTNDFWEKVKKVGVAHVVVASGTNITFVTSFLIVFLSSFMPRRRMIPLVIFGIILYLFISGFDAPLIRAAIMASVTFMAQETGRVVSSWRALTLSALIMLLIKPEWVNDLGFLLSFVATASLILFERRIRESLKYIPEFLKESLSTSLAAQIGVTPILFVTFGSFNILSPLVNVLVLWTIPLIMILGAVGGIIGIFIPLLGKLVLYIGFPIYWWFAYVVNLFS